MKFKTFFVAATAGGIGYVLGTKAGRARFEQIRGQAQDFLKSPTVQDTVANLSETVKQNAAKLPDPVANVVTAAADKVKGSGSAAAGSTDTVTSSPGTSAPATTATTSTDTGASTADSPVGGAGLTDAGLSDAGLSDTGLTDPTTPQSPPQTSSSQ
jgi:hypothetical protein